MAIDAGIYSNIKVPENNSSPINAVENAYKLSALGLQQQQMKYQMQTLGARRVAAARNVDPQTGQFNQAGYISDLFKSAPGEGLAEQERLDKINEQASKAKIAQLQAQHQIVSITQPTLDYMMTQVPPDQRANVWPQMHKRLADAGVPMNGAPPPDQWDDAWGKSSLYTANHTKEGLDNLLTQAQTGKTQSEIGQVGDKYLQAFKDDMDPNKSRGGNLAKNQSVVDAADRLNAMFKQFPDHNIPKAQQTELVSAFGSLLNGGSAPFVSQLEELVPKSARGNANAMMSWVNNEPKGAEQQKFMQLLHDSVNREREVADTKVKTAQVQRISSHQQLFNSNPNGAYAVLNSYGIEPAMIKNGKYVPAENQNTDNVIANSPKAGNGIPGVANANAAEKQPTYRAQGARVTGDEVSKYAIKHNMNLKDAKEYLGSQGYAIDR